MRNNLETFFDGIIGVVVFLFIYLGTAAFALGPGILAAATGNPWWLLLYLLSLVWVGLMNIVLDVF